MGSLSFFFLLLCAIWNMYGMAGVITAILDQEVTLRRKLYPKVGVHKDRDWSQITLWSGHSSPALPTHGHYLHEKERNSLI